MTPDVFTVGGCGRLLRPLSSLAHAPIIHPAEREPAMRAATMVSAQEWAEQTFGSVCLGDERRRRRAVHQHDLCGAGLALLAGVSLHRRAGLDRPTPDDLKEMLGGRTLVLSMMRTRRHGRLGLLHQQIDTAILGRTDHEVTLQVTTQAQERKDIAVAVSQKKVETAYFYLRRINMGLRRPRKD